MPLALPKTKVGVLSYTRYAHVQPNFGLGGTGGAKLHFWDTIKRRSVDNRQEDTSEIHRHTDTEIDVCTCTQIHRYTNTQTKRYSHIQIHTHSEMLFEPRTSVYAVLCTAYFVLCTVHWY